MCCGAEAGCQRWKMCRSLQTKPAITSCRTQCSPLQLKIPCFVSDVHFWTNKDRNRDLNWLSFLFPSGSGAFGPSDQGVGVQNRRKRLQWRPFGRAGAVEWPHNHIVPAGPRCPHLSFSGWAKRVSTNHYLSQTACLLIEKKVEKAESTNDVTRK